MIYNFLPGSTMASEVERPVCRLLMNLNGDRDDFSANFC
jgi:hypothetical protein